VQHWCHFGVGLVLKRSQLFLLHPASIRFTRSLVFYLFFISLVRLRIQTTFVRTISPYIHTSSLPLIFIFRLSFPTIYVLRLSHFLFISSAFFDTQPNTQVYLSRSSDYLFPLPAIHPVTLIFFYYYMILASSSFSVFVRFLWQFYIRILIGVPLPSSVSVSAHRLLVAQDALRVGCSSWTVVDGFSS
jgi:hypothetical protein